MWYDNYKQINEPVRKSYKCPICKKEVFHKGICYDCLETKKEEVQEHEKLLEKRRKYKRGEQILSVDEIFNHKLVYVNHKITHIGFLCSQPARNVYNDVKKGRIFKAIKKEQE